MTSGRLNFDPDVNLPVSGRTPLARHCSSTGAQAAALTISGKLEKLLEHFAKNARATMQEYAAANGWQNNAVCSTFNRAKYELGWVEETGDVKRVCWGTRIAKADTPSLRRFKGDRYEVFTEQAYHRLTDAGRRAWLGHVEQRVREVEARS